MSLENLKCVTGNIYSSLNSVILTTQSGKERYPHLSLQSYWDVTVPRRELLVCFKCIACLLDDENKNLRDHFARKLTLNS